MAVGIFDSGLGGLTVLNALTRRLPDVPFVYFGDNAHTPYGVRDADDIYDLTTHGVQCLFDQGCDLVILACNTASAAALRRMQEGWVPEGKRVLGVFVPLIEALTERKWGDNSPPREVGVKHVALFATPATVSSRAFQRELAFRAIGVDVEAQPCAGVVDAIEMGDMILADALVEDVFREALGPDVAVYSQPELVAAALADYLERRPEMVGPGGESRFLTSGDPVRVSSKATQFLRRKISFDAADV